MGKQKVVINVPMNEPKCRSKVMKIAVGASGVESAALSGRDKNQLEVVGDGIDAGGLTELLKKSVGFAELVTEGQVPEKKNGGGHQKKNEATAPVPVAGYYPYPYPYGAGHVYEIRDHSPDNCSIM